jgi:hypothetical protein
MDDYPSLVYSVTDEAKNLPTLINQIIKELENAKDVAESKESIKQ